MTDIFGNVETVESISSPDLTPLDFTNSLPGMIPVMSLLGKGKKLTTWEKVMLAGVAARGVWKIGVAIHKKVAAGRTVVLRFSEGQTEYTWLKQWLAARKPDDSAAKNRVFAASLSSTCPAKWSLVPHTFQGYTFEGMSIGVSTESPGMKSNGEYRVSKTVVLSCDARRPDDITRLLNSISECGNAGSNIEKTPGVYALNNWGEWRKVSDVPVGRLPVLPGHTFADLLADAEWFQAEREWFQSVGVPYRRGYLLHGVPGSGKTTTAVALAAVLKRDIHILTMEGITEEKMIQAAGGVGSDEILLLEDIDCVAATADREASGGDKAEPKSSISLRGLLNMLDGAATPEGRITIATTNYRDRLDAALTRRGRFDRDIHFGWADAQQIRDLSLRFGATNEEALRLSTLWSKDEIPMATVQERLLETYGLGRRGKEVASET